MKLLTNLKLFDRLARLGQNRPNAGYFLSRFRRSRRRDGATASAQGSRLLRPAILIPLACLLMLGLQAWIEWGARSTEVRETETSLVNLASSLAQHADSTFDVADAAISGLVERLETDGTSPRVLADLDRELAAQIAGGARYGAITIFDGNGNSLASSLPAQSPNAADRDYFRHHRDDPSRLPFVGPPIKSRLTGQWVVTVSRRFQSPDGRFAGIVNAVISLSDFTDHYATYDLGANSSIVLLTTDGTMLASYPPSGQSIGASLSNAAAFSHLHDHTAGSYATTSIVDNVQRLSGYRRSTRYPLLVVASASEDQALGAWRADARLHMAIALVLTVAVGLIGRRLARQMQRSQAAEERARESEDRYREQALDLREANERATLATDSGGIGLWEWHPGQDRMTWNPWMYRLHGMQLDQVPNYAFWQRQLHPDDRAAAEQAVRDCLDGTKPYESEFRVVWSDGSIHHIHGTGRARRDADGVVVRFVGANWDITDRVTAENALRESTSTFRLLADHANDIVTRVGPDGMRRYISPAAQRIFGVPPALLLGKNMLAFVHPDDRQAMLERIERLKTGGSEEKSPNFRVVRPDGLVVWIEASSQTLSDPLTGAPDGYVSVLRDVTERRASIAALSESEERYRLLLQSGGITEALYMLDVDGNVESWNAGAERIKGYAPAEIIGRNFSTFFTPEGIENGEPAHMLAAARDGGQLTRTGWRVRKDASRFWARVTLEAVRREDGSLRGFANVTHDITSERIEQEQRAILNEAQIALRESEERYRLLADHSTDLIVVVDGQFIRRYVSPSCRVLLGYEPEALIGGSADLFLHPEDAWRVVTAFQELITKGSPGSDRITYRLRHRDQHWVWVEAVLKVVKYAEDGLAMEVCAALRDVTNRMQVEIALRESEETLHLLLHSNVTEALYLLGPDGTVESWNASAERIKGYTAAEIIGQNFTVFFTPEDVAAGAPEHALAQARDHGHFATTGWRVRKDGSRFMARVAIDAIRRLDRTLRGYVKVTNDITRQQIEEAERDRLTRDLAMARDQAEEASKAKSGFLAGVTHELRTPLHGMLGYAELLMLEGDLNPTQSKRLEVMIDSGEHLLDLINSVLDMSLIEADRLELLPVEIELPSLIHSCLNVVRPGAAAKGLVLAPAPSSALLLFADAMRVRQVLINLLGNAIKFTPTGSVEVRMRLTEDGACIRFEVVDTGPGISLRHRDKLFQTFERLNAEAVSGIEGAGLGLSLAARLVQLMGGQMGYADNPGGGSVFWFELPASDAVSPDAIEAVASSPLTTTRRLLVLVADDEPLNRSIASSFLGKAGHEVVCVEDGAAAVAAASASDFDVILMDVRMPGMNGMEATRLIRALPGPRGEVRVVAVTAQAFAQQIDMCRQAGMDTHVSKPFKQAVLLAALVDTEPTSRPHTPVATPSTADAEPEFPVFDRDMFEDITDQLDAEQLEEHLRTLFTRCEALLLALQGPGMPLRASEFSDDAHQLAGGAGTFGFLSVAAAARQFEVAAITRAAQTTPLADQLVAAIEASMPLIHQELAATASIAT